METSALNEKGQLTIPAAIRKRLNLSPGDKLRLFVEDDGSLHVIPATGSIRDLRATLPKPVKTVSIEDMNAGIEEAAAEHVTRNARD